MAAAADCRGRRRFTVACGVLSQRIRADAKAAKTVAAALAGASRAPAPPTMLLMPGAQLARDATEVQPSPAKAEAAHAQLTIMYGGRVIVFDDVPKDGAEKLVRVASAPAGGLADMRVARKASLRRFMEKRRDRLAARAPYGASRPEALLASNFKKGKAAEEADAGSWLGLGIPGGNMR